jgi:hypothetical protein
MGLDGRVAENNVHRQIHRPISITLGLSGEFWFEDCWQPQVHGDPMMPAWQG